MASSDEEQLEALQRWWKENGTSLMVGIAIVLVGFFGWRQWQSSQEESAAQASALYQQMADLTAVNAEGSLSEEELSTASYLNDQLRSEHADSIYAKFSALFMARVHVEAGDLAAAEAELSWILDNRDVGFMNEVNDALFLTARGRLARVVLARGDAERALELLQAVEPGEYAGTYAEIEGDAYMALGEREQAGDAYQRALDAGAENALIELKLQDLGL